MNFFSFYLLVLFYLFIHPSIHPSIHQVIIYSRIHSFFYTVSRSFIQHSFISLFLPSFCLSFFLCLFIIITIFKFSFSPYISTRKQAFFCHYKSYSLVRALQHFSRLMPPLFSKLSIKIMFPPNSGGPSQTIQLVCAREFMKPVQEKFKILTFNLYILCQKALSPFDCTHENVFAILQHVNLQEKKLSQNMVVRLQFN